MTLPVRAKARGVNPTIKHSEQAGGVILVTLSEAVRRRLSPSAACDQGHCGGERVGPVSRHQPGWSVLVRMEKRS